MNESVFEYLELLGFSINEINYIEEKNDNIVYANLNHVKQIILFLQKLNLNNEDIKKICVDNVFMITETFRRVNKLNDIYYGDLGFTTSQIKQLILNNANIYTINPNNLETIIEYLIKINYSKESIKELLLNKSEIIGMSIEKLKEIIYIN